MPARSVCLVTLSLSEAGPGHGPGRFGRQSSLTDIYHTIRYHPKNHTNKLSKWKCVFIMKIYEGHANVDSNWKTERAHVKMTSTIVVVSPCGFLNSSGPCAVTSDGLLALHDTNLVEGGVMVFWRCMPPIM